MRIEIDTKEDLHNIRHIIRLLQAISGHLGKDSYKFNDDLFSESSSTPNPVSNPDTSASLFSMFGDSSGSSSSSSSSSTGSSSSPDPYGIPSIFDEKKKDEDKKDFLDSVQVY